MSAYNKRLLWGLSLIVISILIIVVERLLIYPFLIAHYFGAAGWFDRLIIPIPVLFSAFYGSFLVGKSLAVGRKRMEWLAGLGLFVALAGGLGSLIFPLAWPVPWLSVLIGGFLVGLGLPPAMREVKKEVAVTATSIEQKRKIIKKLVLAISLAMLAAGITGFAYCLIRIIGLSEVYNPAYPEYQIEQKIETLALLGAVNATAAIAGGLSTLAFFFLLRRGWLRKGIFAFGALLLLAGTFGFARVFLETGVGPLRWYPYLLDLFAIMFSIGLAIIGALTCAACLFLPGPRK